MGGTWTLFESDDYRLARDKLEPAPRQYAANFEATRVALERDPDLYSIPLFDDDPDRRVLSTFSFWPGWELVVAFDLDRARRTVTLLWVEARWVGPEGAADDFDQ